MINKNQNPRCKIHTSNVVRSLLLLLLLLGPISYATAHTLSGTIKGGSDPLPDATVKLVDTGNGGVVGTITSDVNGDYSFTVDDGNFILNVTSPEDSIYQNSLNNGIVISGENEILDIVLLSGGFNLSGVIRYPNGDLTKGVVVRVYDAGTGSPLADTTTDATGRYQFTLPAGTYRLRLDLGLQNVIPATVGSSWYDNAYQTDFVLDQDTELEYVLPFVQVSGKTLDANGAAIGDVLVGITGSYSLKANSSYNGNAAGHFSFSIKSDAEGNYAFWVPAYNDYTLLIEPPEGSGLPVTTVAGVDFSADTVRDFSLVSGFNLGGVIRYPNGDLTKGVVVRVYDAGTGSPLADTTTDATGRYQFTLPAGTYRLRLDLGLQNVIPATVGSSWYDNAYQTDFVLDQDTELEYVLPFVQVSGKTLDANGAAIGDVLVGITGSYSLKANSSYNGNAAGHFSFSIKSDAEGNYAFWVPAYNDYTLLIEPPEGSGLPVTTVAGVDFSADTVRDFSLVSGFNLGGVIRYPNGDLTKGVVVRVYDAGTGSPLADTTTDATGRYQFTLPAGTYRLRLDLGLQNVIPATVGSSWYDNAYQTDFVLDQDTELEYVLPFVQVSGKTLDANGVAIGDVLVGITGSYSLKANSSYNGNAAGHFSFSIKSDAEGNYAFWVPAHDDYTLLIQPPAASGFPLASVANVDFSTARQLNLILPIDDSRAPRILAGPYAREVTDSSATVTWQTDEPATSVVEVDGSTFVVEGYRRDHSVVITGLLPSTTYTATVESTDPSGNGPTTATVEITTLATPDEVAPLIISGPIVTEITHNSVVIKWGTNEAATTHLNYGLDDALDQSVTEVGLRDVHRIELTGLNGDTAYSVQVQSSDAAGNGPAISPVIRFNTLSVPDMIPPVIVSGPMVVNITQTEAMVIWETDEPAVSGVSLTDGEAHRVIRDENLVTLHEIRITGLTPDTLYEYTASSADVMGNGPTLSRTASFQTLAVADEDPPVVTEPLKIVGITHQSAVVHWRTDEPSDSRILYGTSPDDLNLFTADAKLKQKHVVHLTQLTRDTVYYLKAESTDTSGNRSATPVIDFTTRDLPDVAKPTFTQLPTVVGQTDTTVTVQWHTDEPADGVVEYGQGSSIDRRRSNGEKKTKHSVTLTGLAPGATHSFVVSSTDTSGNVTRFSQQAAPLQAQTRVDTPFERLMNWLIHPAVAADNLATGFITDNNPDNTAPGITQSPMVEYLTDTLALIVWTTDEVSDSQVSFAPTGATTPQLTGDITPVFSHLQVLTNLTPNTEYSYQISSTDITGNTTTSITQTFTTPASQPDITLSITEPVATGLIIDSQAALIVGTSHHAVCRVDYGTAAGNLNEQLSVVDLNTSHDLLLNNLLPGTTYYYQVSCEDLSGNTANTEMLSLQTLEFFDTDGDGTVNNADTDDDNDGVPDASDAFPLDATESVDTDGDGTGNNADTDDDNDGVPDASDAFPLDATESVDTDRDGTGNNADIDDDNDGVPDASDAFPLDATESVDTDGDGTGNNADTDDDNDGVPDASDAFPLDATESVDTDGDGTGNNADTDADNDGMPDASDAFPLDATRSLDTDGDGTENNADTDDDNDYLPDAYENAKGLDPLNPTDALLDFDGDGESNLKEYENRTDPLDPYSSLALRRKAAISVIKLLLN